MTPAPRPRPSWQRDPCPSWCVVQHEEHDPPGDRVHDSAGVHVPVVLGSAGGRSPDSPTELLLVLSQRWGRRDDWIFMGEPELDGQFLLMTRESAARLHRALDRLLDRAATPDP